MSVGNCLSSALEALGSGKLKGLSFFPSQLLDVDPNDQEEDGANIDLDSQRKGKCAVIKTSTRQVRLAL